MAVNLDVLKQLVGHRTVTDEVRPQLAWQTPRPPARSHPLHRHPAPLPERQRGLGHHPEPDDRSDNLEVLKFLQKSYAGKVKLIYIDPPYNTGKDFVYPDNLSAILHQHGLETVRSL